MALVYLDDSNPVATTATSTTPAAVAATLAEGDYAFILVNYKRPASATLSTPAGWSKLIDVQVGTGSPTSDAGPVKLVVFHARAGVGGALTLPTLTLGGTTTGAAIQAGLVVYRGDLGAGGELAYATASGSDTSSGTGYSVTAGSDPGVLADDIMLLFTGTTSDSPTASSPTLTQTGVTYGTISSPWSTSTGNGDDMRSTAYRATASSGTSSAAPVHGFTLSSGTTGGTAFLRLREVETRRFYLTNVAPSFAPGDTPYPGDIADAGSITDALANPRLLGTEPAGSSDSVSRTETSTAASYVAMGRQFVSHPATAGGTITGNWQLGIGGEETATGADMRPYLQVWVTQGDSATLRGADAVVFAGGAIGLEFGTSPAGRLLGNPTPVQTEVTFQAGDRIIVEVSIYNTNASATSYTGTLYYGGTGSPDLASGTTDMNRPGWVDLQITPGVTFESPAADIDGTATAALGFSASADGTITGSLVTGTASARLAFSATAHGEPGLDGTASAALGFSAVALGVPETEGSGSAALTFTASAAGTREVTGPAATVLAFSATVAGERDTSGSATASLGGLAATATGSREVVADGSTAFGFAAVASGEGIALASGAAQLGFTAEAAGQRDTSSLASAAFGFLASTLGDVGVQVSGTGSASLGFSTAGAGKRQTFGAGLLAVGFTSTATGQRDVSGGASATLAFDAYAVVDEQVTAPETIVRPRLFAASLVARVPAASGAPTFVEVDRLVFAGLSYTDELNRPGQATLSCPVRTLSDAVKERLGALDQFPSEVWVYWGTDIVWAGEVQTLQVQEQTLNINCAGLLGYTWRMGVTSDLEFDADDQFTIAKGLIDHWQALSYGHYGIDTSGVTTSGVTRDRTYLRDELHNIGQRLEELGAVDDGFDMRVDPSTRDLLLTYPTQGDDLSASVFFDELNIDSAGVVLSVGPDDLVTDGSFTGSFQGSSGSNTTTYAARENTALRATYGRSWGSENFSNVTVGETVEGHGDAFLAARDGVMFQPGVTIVPRMGTDVGDFGPGDTVSYSYDAGLGRQSGTYRVAKVSVSVNESGETRIGVEFV